MAKKPTIRSGLFQPTEPVEQASPNKISPSIQSFEPAPPVQIEEPDKVEELRVQTSTRLPITVQEYFEGLAVEHGYSAHSLRIFAMTWFVKEHQAGNIKLERDRTVKGRRVIAMPEIHIHVDETK